MGILQEIQLAPRVLARRPGLAVVVVLTLAIGVGASCAVFSVVNAVLLRPLPYHDPDHLVTVWQVNLARDIAKDAVSPANYLDLRRQSRAFSDMAAAYLDPFSLTGVGEPERVMGGLSSASLLPVMGVKPLLGRSFTPDDDRPGSRVVILGEGLWRRRFGGDLAILNRRIQINGQSYTVIGVMPHDFDFPAKAELWVPLALEPDEAMRRGSRYLTVVGRLAPGRTIQQASQELHGLMRNLAAQFPKLAGWNATLIPLKDEVVGDVRLGFMVLLGAVGFVLLVACSNVASLLLARAASRQREVGIRTALGARRRDLLIQVLAESLLLALLGGGLGILLTAWGIKPLVALAGADIRRLSEVQMDFHVLGFAIALTLLTALLCGLPPALQFSRSDVRGTLNESSARTTSGLSRQRLRSAIVVAEVAMALVLLIGASLLIRSFQRLQAVDLGFKTAAILRVQIGLPEAKYPDKTHQAAFFQEVLERVAALPGVQAAAAVTTVPLTSSALTYPFTILEGPQAERTEQVLAGYDAISPEYFRAMGIRLIQGRGVNDHDRAGAPGVVVINQTLAKHYWSGVSPIGQHIKIGDGGPNPREIVGIVQDVRHGGPHADPREEVYVPFTQSPSTDMSLVIRASMPPGALAANVRSQVWSVDPNQPISSSDTLEKLFTTSIARPRFNMLLLTLFAVIAFALAMIGVYGLVSYSVAQRTGEMGIRLALGAQSGQILRLVLSESMKLVVAGVAVGLAMAAAASRVLGRLLFGVSAFDPVNLLLITLSLALVALVATYIPARRVLKVDPAVAILR
jgi:putative ABC transport system permease protein